MLSVNEESLCLEYIICGNKTTALKNSSYATAGLSDKQISEKQRREFNKKAVRERIGELMEKRALRVGVDADWVLSEAVDLYNVARGCAELPLALQTLNTIGKHVDVQAFKERVDVAVVDHASILEARIVNAERVRKTIS